MTKVVDLSAPNLAQKQREASNVEALKQGLYLFVGFLCNQLTNPTSVWLDQIARLFARYLAIYYKKICPKRNICHILLH